MVVVEIKLTHDQYKKSVHLVLILKIYALESFTTNYLRRFCSIEFKKFIPYFKISRVPYLSEP
jgi:predicted CDP-diglyceride synthetase/phosphatidate cytidylyltransferase